jgi:plastocyanin
MGRCTGRALVLATALVFSPGPLAAGKAHQVTIEGMKFVPESLEVAPGDTVTWTNKDFVPHTVTAGKSIESGTIEANGSWTYVAKQKGRFDYLCRFHPGMRAMLVVK